VETETGETVSLQTFESTTHVCHLRGDGFSVGAKRQAMVRETRIQGVEVVQTTRPATEVFPGMSEERASNVFDAWPDRSDDGFQVDVNCGVQRWVGYKPRREVQAALKKCGFSTGQVKQILRAA
jgi:hypothetical protein